MFAEIARRQIFQNILTTRFTIGVVVCVVFVSIGCYVMAGDYEGKLAAYHQSAALYEEWLHTYGDLNTLQFFEEQPPGHLEILFTRSRPLMRSGGIVFEGAMSFQLPPARVLFRDLDVGKILGFVLTLLAMVFGYDAIAGERERGTLKVMLSNSVSRSTLLLGKLTGHLICLLVPIGLSLLIVSLIVLLSGSVQFSAGDWLSLGIIFSWSLVLATAFFIVTLSVSCWVRSALGALFVSLAIWVLLVLVVPSVSLHIGAAFEPIPSRMQLERQMKDAAHEIALQYDKEISDKREEMSQREAEVFFTKSYIAQQKARAKVYGAFTRKLYAQMELARRIALISPFSCFLQIARTFSGTGMLSERRFDRAAADFKWIALRYMVDKDEEFYQSGRNIAERVEIMDVPRLKYEGESLSGKVKYSLLPISALIVFCGFFFSATYMAFLRYDVR